MRWAVALCLAAGCGDNAADCGYVHSMSAFRNIWSPQLAVDDTNIYYSDYNIDGDGTHIVLRQLRGGGPEIAIGVRPPQHGFGYGMAVDATFLYWTALTDPTGYAVFATPLQGGRALELATMPDCEARGLAVDAASVYAGTIRCNGLMSQVIAVAGGMTTLIWESAAADVEDIAAHDGLVYIATTGGLVVFDGATITLLDGHPTHRLHVRPDELVYSTDEGIFGLAFAGGTPRRLHVFRTDIGEQRAFAIDDAGLYVSEPPQIVFVPAAGGDPIELVANAGSGVAYIVARDRVAYWSAIALPNTLGSPDSFSGGVLRVTAPCD